MRLQNKIRNLILTLKVKLQRKNYLISLHLKKKLMTLFLKTMIQVKMKECQITKLAATIPYMLEKFCLIDTSLFRNLDGVIFQLFGWQRILNLIVM
jgi:hypothetical protein